MMTAYIGKASKAFNEASSVYPPFPHYSSCTSVITFIALLMPPNLIFFLSFEIAQYQIS
jgi:hypothetical protein